MTINEDIIAEAPGLHRAKLATIRTRSWMVEGQPLTGEQVVDYYCKIRDRELFDIPRSSRRWDRATSILKRAGLVVYKNGRWRCTDEINI